VRVLTPTSLDEALALRQAEPGARPLLGGTDLLVELNFGRSRPEVVIDLARVPELRGWGRDNGRLRLGAGLTYARAVRELGPHLPGLALAARTIGSPQIRNRGTVGGNLGTASPAGDAHPPLVAARAEVELASASRGTRLVPLPAYFLGPGRSVLEPDELVTAVHVAPAAGAEQFAKVGTRNAMVIAVCSLALAIWPERRAVCACIGSAGPTPIRAAEAEAFIAGVLDEEGLWEGRGAPSGAALERFGELVAAAAAPIDDVRGSAAYRRQALGVLARRTLTWVWEEQRCA
jgi:CO/xanthine dehydrogenase FAD-binding subunit